ncbi:Probable phosphoglycerate mutase GpmB [Seminavis robusta]|uniref:Probable phosphoglycerate mutase GpmB n=1 Tax=Seminavis robusta TaxID=568900 RepID=A0A9N8HR17_9STRA|nr:Probable phosphoglycerate mutase GpmB [Seminavis robusta]|eukprot:Sro1511_g278740.1 Probable phosphoglycerate mutase GpmB (308) ;mRNA; r:17113-18134
MVSATQLCYLLFLFVVACLVLEGTMASNDGGSNTFTLRLFLVRHGETVSNREGLVAGQAESALTEQGERQAVALGKSGRLLLGQYWRIYASDLQRTQDTTRLILQGYKSAPTDTESSCPDVRLDVRLRELSKGARQGYPKSFNDQQAMEARRREAQNRGETFLPETVPAVESERDAYNRFLNWLLEVAGEAVREQGQSTKNNIVLSTLVVSHSAFLRAILTHMFTKQELIQKGATYDANNPTRLLIPNTSVTTLDILIHSTSSFWKQQPSQMEHQQSVIRDGEEKFNGSIWQSKLQDLTWTGHYELV